ncbi:MAG: LpxL/LpxP family Kdo(2)-lipid IV(A) lauroyl/palmitoleoyl acyltransferase [Nitrospira sp.]|nr:LpxL/LpxP family Kdo(2)-lipid IV(A) lauroyl/palmitoleoyl acyltransferase [Nitrospira sp.]
MSSTNTRSQRQQPHSPYHPLYWPTWVGFGLFRLLSLLPYRGQLALGRQCGRLLHSLLTRRRDIVRVNLALCFPHKAVAERDRVALHCFESMGMGMLEIGLAWWAKDPRVHCECTIKGLEHIQEALHQGRGVLLCGAHLHTAELAGRFLALEQPIAIVYRPQNDDVAETVANRCRSRYYSELIQHRDIRGVLRALAKNLVVWYAPDIDAGSKRSVFAPFFGVPAASLTATSRLAKVSGAPVVPCFYYRRADGSGYDIEVGPALDQFPSDEVLDDTVRINRLIEGAVRRVPEQYFWQHRRFKSRPPGEPSVYQR